MGLGFGWGAIHKDAPWGHKATYVCRNYSGVWPWVMSPSKMICCLVESRCFERVAQRRTLGWCFILLVTFCLHRGCTSFAESCPPLCFRMTTFRLLFGDPVMEMEPLMQAAGCSSIALTCNLYITTTQNKPFSRTVCKLYEAPLGPRL